MESLSLQPVFGPVVLTILLLAALATLLVGPSFRNVDFRKRLTLTLLRAGVILLAFITLLRPGCVQKIEKNQAAVVMVLLDISRSMELPHVSDDSTRWKVLKKAINDNRGRIATLIDNKVDVRFRLFDRQSEAIEFKDGDLDLPDEPTGSETDIGTALYDAALDVRDRPLLAVILASDGVQNVLEPDVELVAAVDALKDMEVPLVAVQLGTPGESGQLADVAVTSFAEQLVVNKKSDLLARTTIVARGYKDEDITVDLLISNGDSEEVVATEVIRPDKSYQEMTLALKYRPETPGEYRIKVRANPMPGELAVRNNSLDGFLTVRDEGMRVLFINGGLKFEQARLRDSLKVEFIDLDFLPIFTDNRSRQSWPLNELAAEFSEPNKYDVFILNNVDSRALYDHQRGTGPLVELTEAIKNGKGLLMIGGTHSFGAGLYQHTPLADVLPIRMNARERQDFGQDIRPELHINSPLKLAPTRSHFLTRISDTGANRESWEALPALFGANRITPKPTGEVLLQSDDEARRPIMVKAEVGGRVVVFAGDTTWRWITHGFEAQFDQFWRQVVLWLAFWDSRDDESVSIDLPKRRFAPKSRMKFGVNVSTTTGEAIAGVQFQATLKLPNGQEQPITVSRSGEQYESEIDPDLLTQAGVYRVKVSAEHDGQSIGTSEREFVVIDRDKERSNPAANPEQLARLAAETSQYGGQAIEPEQLASVLDELIENPKMKKIEIPTKWRIGETMADASGFMLVFVGLLAVEWFLRKKWGLV